MNQSRPWTPAELQTALDMKAAGASTSDIGQRLQRSGNSVLKALRRAGLPNIKFVQVWPAEQAETAQRMWAAGKSAAEIGRAIGRTRNSVLGMAHRNRDTWAPHPHTVSQALACKQGRKDRAIRKPPANVLKFGGARMSSEIKPPMPLAAVEPAPENAVTLGARTSRMCCFPVGDASGADQLFCGGDKARGDYCAFHHGVMYAKRAA